MASPFKIAEGRDLQHKARSTNIYFNHVLGIDKLGTEIRSKDSIHISLCGGREAIDRQVDGTELKPPSLTAEYRSTFQCCALYREAKTVICPQSCFVVSVSAKKVDSSHEVSLSFGTTSTILTPVNRRIVMMAKLLATPTERR